MAQPPTRPRPYSVLSVLALECFPLPFPFCARRRPLLCPVRRPCDRCPRRHRRVAPTSAGSLFYAARGACQSVEACNPRTALSTPWRTPRMCPIKPTRYVLCLLSPIDAISKAYLVQETQPRLLKPPARSQRHPAARATAPSIQSHERTRIQRRRRYSCRGRCH